MSRSSAIMTSTVYGLICNQKTGISVVFITACSLEWKRLSSYVIFELIFFLDKYLYMYMVMSCSFACIKFLSKYVNYVVLLLQC